jgi:response regulator of citrate/malate metabolism
MRDKWQDLGYDAHKATLLGIIDANDTPQTYQTLTELASATGGSRSTVNRRLQELIESKDIEQTDAVIGKQDTGNLPAHGYKLRRYGLTKTMQMEAQRFTGPNRRTKATAPHEKMRRTI